MDNNRVVLGCMAVVGLGLSVYMLYKLSSKPSSSSPRKKKNESDPASLSTDKDAAPAAGGEPPQGPEGESERLRQEGNALFQRKDFEGAVKVYTQAINVHPTPALFTNRAAAYNRLGMFKWALADADHALKESQSNSRAHERRGQSLLGLGRYAEAVQALEQAVALSDNAPSPALADALKDAKQKLALQKPGLGTILEGETPREDGGEKPAKEEEPAKEELAKEEPAKEEPAKEEPAKEEPAKEEPAKEEPAKEEDSGSEVAENVDEEWLEAFVGDDKQADSKPAQEEATPAKQEDKPAKEEATPAKEEKATPAKEEKATPAKEEKATPAKEEKATPAKEEEATPAKEEATPAKEEDKAEGSEQQAKGEEGRQTIPEESAKEEGDDKGHAKHHGGLMSKIGKLKNAVSHPVIGNRKASRPVDKLDAQAPEFIPEENPASLPHPENFTPRYQPLSVALSESEIACTPNPEGGVEAEQQAAQNMVTRQSDFTSPAYCTVTFKCSGSDVGGFIGKKGARVKEINKLCSNAKYSVKSNKPAGGKHSKHDDEGVVEVKGELDGVERMVRELAGVKGIKEGRLKTVFEVRMVNTLPSMMGRLANASSSSSVAASHEHRFLRADFQKYSDVQTALAEWVSDAQAHKAGSPAASLTASNVMARTMGEREFSKLDEGLQKDVRDLIEREGRLQFAPDFIGAR